MKFKRNERFSTSYARPVLLTRATEERDVFSVELEPSFEVIRNEYQTTLVQDDVTIKVNVKTECSMLDGKMVSLQQGDRGAFCHLCHLCHATGADANDPRLITNGFVITKDYASCKEAWDKFAGDIVFKQ